MALDKALDIHDTAMPLSYWRITHTRIDHGAGRVEMVLHGWRDEAARRAGSAPGAKLAFDATREELGTADLHSVGTASLYAALKQRAGAAPEALARPAESLQQAIGMRDPRLLAGATDC